MTVFWVMAGIMMASALAFVLVPLVRPGTGGSASGASRLLENVRIHRDQLRQLQADHDRGALGAEAFEAERAELGKRALEDALAALDEDLPSPARSGRRWAAIIVAVALPLLAVGLYSKLGAPERIAPMARAAGTDSVPDTAPRANPHGMSFDQIRASADALATRLQREPEDGEGWATLARSYNVLGQFEQAAGAFEKAVARLPADAQLLADYADAVAMAQGQRLEGKPREIIDRALRADPANLKALALAGSAAFERKDYRSAVGYWEKVVRTAPAGSEFAGSVKESLDEARALLDGRTPVASLPSIMPAPPTAPVTTAGIRGTVSLAPALASRARPDDTVFIFARAENGPRMPLAIVSKPFRDLPTSFTLDDASAMAPGMKLSGAPAVMIVARVSRSGSAAAQPGDLEGSIGPIRPGARGIQLKIDRVVP